MTTLVWGIAGPRAAQVVELEDDAVAAATAPAPDGWAITMEPGTVLYVDQSIPHNPAWVIPGYNPADFGLEGGDGGPPPEPPANDPVPITSISNAVPAVVTISTAEIARFADGNTVTIAGVPLAADIANGAHVIAGVSAGAGTFELTGVDLVAAPAPITDPGMTALPPAPPASRGAGESRHRRNEPAKEPAKERERSRGYEDDARTSTKASRK